MARWWRDRPKTTVAVELKVFEKKAFLRHGKGLRKYTQSAEDDYARTKQWTFTDKGSRYQVFREEESTDGVVVTYTIGEGL